MKVGILSMQQVVNVGSFLQAYGLKMTLKALGHDVDFIDIVPGKQLSEFKGGKIHTISKALKRLICANPYKMVYYSLKYHKLLKSEINSCLKLDDNNTLKHFDSVVIGSDEVWNFAQKTWFGFSPQLFGEGLNADSVISYAACCGATTTETAERLGLKNDLEKYLSRNFMAISVRDENSRNFVKDLTGVDPIINIDPVLLYNFSKEIPLSSVYNGGRFLLIYTYPNRMKAKHEVKAIKDYARKNNLVIVSINNYFDWVDDVVIATPFEVLAYFRDAACIVTDTFHGAIMSIKFNKQFATIVRDMNSNKLTGLLNQFGLQSRVVDNTDNLESIMNKVIDFALPNEIIKNERIRSINYLTENLEMRNETTQRIQSQTGS